MGMIEPSLLEAVPGGAAFVDLQGRVEAVNLLWAGTPPGNPFLDGMAPGADYLKHCQALSKSKDGHVSLVAVGILSALAGKLKRINLEYPLPSDPETRWFALTSTMVSSGLIIAHLEITERMKWERKMRRGERLFKATTENALDLQVVLGTDGKVIYANPSYAKTLGYPPSTLVGWNPLDTVYPEDRALFEEQCLAGFTAGLSPLFEYRVLHQDGTIRHMEARAVCVETPTGDRESLLLTSQDITARKEAQAQKDCMEIDLRHAQKMEAIGQLAAGIAHEINTPCQYLINNMGFLAEAFGSVGSVFAALEPLLLQASPGPELAALKAKMETEDFAYLLEEAPRAIDQSLEGLTRIATIVKAMKIFGHPGAEGKTDVNLNEALENTLVVTQSEWKYLAEVRTNLASGLPLVLGSLGELNQVFLNLIVNAAHAIEEKGLAEKGLISIATRAAGAEVEFQITDTGAGIPESIRDRVFLPFFTTKAVGKGTGQGLALAHAIIAKHGGAISFTSQLGEGTCFTIRLPAVAAP